MPPVSVTARDAVLQSAELLCLILEQLVSLIACFSDVKLVLQSRAVCKEWCIGASVMRANCERRWALSCHTVCHYSRVGVGTDSVLGFVGPTALDGVFVGGPHRIGMFKKDNRDELFPLHSIDIPCGLPELLCSLLNDDTPFAQYVIGEGAQAVVEDAHGANYMWHCLRVAWPNILVPTRTFCPARKQPSGTGPQKPMSNPTGALPSGAVSQQGFASWVTPL